jgi:coatomer subunit beta
VSRATGAGEVKEELGSSLKKVHQLTGALNTFWLHRKYTDRILGFTDPIYAEAYVKIQGFDIFLGEWM